MAKPDLQNRFAVRAKLYSEMTDQQAQRIASATNQPPADSTDMTKKPDQLVRAWNYTPSLTPEQDFWKQHDQVLQQSLAQLPPNADPEAIQAAHNQAEMQALQATYPYRADLIGVGSRMLDDQVAQVSRIKKIVDGQTEIGGG